MMIKRNHGRGPASFVIRIAPIVLALWLVGPASFVEASPLVSDGDFENVDFGVMRGFPYTGSIGDGWVVTEGGVNIYSGVGGAAPYLPQPYSGNQFAFLGDIDWTGNMRSQDQLNVLSQHVATTVGQTYTLSFFADGVAPGDFEVKFGDQVLYDGAGRTRSSSAYELYTYVVTATSADTLLTFTGTNNWWGWGPSLDDVSLVPGAFPMPNPDPVPEPASWIVVGVLAGWGYLRVRRRGTPHDRATTA